MSADVHYPIPYPDVNAVLHRLLFDVKTALKDQFIAMYIHGSLASGDFDPQHSDIDFLVVTADELPDEMLPTLEAMHGRITASGLKWATKLEGSYIPQHALRRYDPTKTQYPSLRVDGGFGLDEHGSDWVIQRCIIREQGIPLAGPAPQTLIDPVQPNDLRCALREILREWWSPMLHDHTRLHSSEYQAYAILTMCRALYTLQHGTVVSKAIAARWAQKTLGKRWVALIEQAIAWRHDAQMDNIKETLDLIQHTIEHSKEIEINK